MRKANYRILSLLLLVSLVWGCAGPSATPTTAPATTSSGTGLQLTGAVAQEEAWTEDEVKALPTIQIQYTNRAGETNTYTGVSLSHLVDLAQPNPEANVVILVADDGYRAQIPLSELHECSDCILSFREEGGFSSVMPGYPGTLQVRGVIEIQVVADPTADAMPDAPDKPSAPAGGPITVTDAAGRMVRLEGPPQRLMVIGRGSYMTLHLLYMFPEGRERLVAVEQRGATASDFLPFVDPEFGEIAALAANPGPEQVAAHRPDLVIIKAAAMDEMANSLSKVGIPVLHVDLETPEAFFQDVANVGAVLGNSARADEIIGFYQKRLERIALATAEMSQQEKPRILIVEYSERGGEVAVRIPPPGWMQTIQAQAVGANPVWLADVQMTDGWTVANVEQIAAWNPDKIFAVIHHSLDPAEVIAGLKADANWSKLKAAQGNEIWAFPADFYGWDNPEPRWLLGMQWLATRVHPELFADLDVQEEIYKYFGKLYDMDKADVDAHILPKVKLDVH